jgi:1-acyl-sn-glycerol-3-phosphate acyltransferase
MFIIFVISKMLNLNIKNSMPRLFHQGFLKLLNVKVILHGTLKTNKPGLLISNHASWIDISILSSLTNICFIAKSEVSGWPIVGFLARLQDTVFIERKINRVIKQKKEILDFLSKGKKLVLFPEGTSSDGNRVLRFKSSLFSIGETEEGKLGRYEFQAVTICYSGLNGLPMSRSQRPNVAWWGNMNLFNHLWNLFSLNGIKVTVTAHEPITNIENRKIMSQIAWRQISFGMGKALSGCPEPVSVKETADSLT